MEPVWDGTARSSPQASTRTAHSPSRRSTSRTSDPTAIWQIGLLAGRPEGTVAQSQIRRAITAIQKRVRVCMPIPGAGRVPIHNPLIFQSFNAMTERFGTQTGRRSRCLGLRISQSRYTHHCRYRSPGNPESSRGSGFAPRFGFGTAYNGFQQSGRIRRRPLRRKNCQ